MVEIVNGSKQPIIQVSLNGRNAYFLIDTGSDVTCLQKNDAKKYEFKYQKSYSKSVVAGINASAYKHYIGKSAHMTLQNVPIRAKFRVLDLSTIIESIYQDSGIRINGIIGSDVLREYHFIIDYCTGKISFHQ
jgi:predicted aspartyl protease